MRFSADCPKYRHLAPVSYHVTALKKSSSASSCRAAAAASASEGESSEESESESELSESREEGELDAALASFHPRQLKNMPRVELQHLVVKVGVSAKVSNDDLRAVLTKWWQKRNQRTSPAKQAPRKAERAASPSADELLEDFDPVCLDGLRREKLQNMCVAIGHPARVSNDMLKATLLKWHRKHPGGKKRALVISDSEGEEEEEEEGEEEGEEEEEAGSEEASEDEGEDAAAPARDGGKGGGRAGGGGAAGAGAKCQGRPPAGKRAKGGKQTLSVDAETVPLRLKDRLLRDCLEVSGNGKLIDLPRPTTVTDILARFEEEAR